MTAHTTASPKVPYFLLDFSLMNISSEARILLTWFSVVSLWLVWNARLVYSIAWLCIKSQHV